MDTATLPDRARELIAELQLSPHPEGGWYRRIFESAQRVQPQDDRPLRPALTAIWFLLARGEYSAWHRVRSDESWNLLEGEGIRLHTFDAERERGDAHLLMSLARSDGQGQPMHVVPAGIWQAAEPLGDYALVSCQVGPGFDFADWVLLRDMPDLAARVGAIFPAATALL